MSAPETPIVFWLFCWSTEPFTYSLPLVIFAWFWKQRLPSTYRFAVTLTLFCSVMSQPLSATPDQFGERLKM